MQQDEAVKSLIKKQTPSSNVNPVSTNEKPIKDGNNFNEGLNSKEQLTSSSHPFSTQETQLS